MWKSPAVEESALQLSTTAGKLHAYVVPGIGIKTINELQ